MKETSTCRRNLEPRNAQKNPDRDQNPPQGDNNPRDLFGNLNKNQECGENGEIADGIDEVHGHSRRWQNATQKIHDELAYVMSQRIQEGQDRVKDVLPRYFSERRPSVHHCMHTEIPFSGYCFTRSSISICGPVMASRPLTTPDV